MWWGFKTYALLHEDAELALIFNLDELLAAVSRVGAVIDSKVSKILNLFTVLVAPRAHDIPGVAEGEEQDENRREGGRISRTYMFNFILSCSQSRNCRLKESEVVV